MLALNFQSPNNEDLLLTHKKNCTIRLGDLKDTYPENSIVWITAGSKFGPKRKLYPAMIDKILTKRFRGLTTHDLINQNPEITSTYELLSFFENLYQKSINLDDTVTIIYFSEVTEK